MASALELDNGELGPDDAFDPNDSTDGEDGMASALELDNGASSTAEEYELISLLDSGRPLFRQLGRPAGASAVSFENVMDSIHRARQTDKEHQLESLEKVCKMRKLAAQRGGAPLTPSLLEADPQATESKRFMSAT